MRILIVTTHVPFVNGGAETHARSLCTALEKRGHEAEIARIPFKWYPPQRIHEHILSCRLLDLQESNGVPIDKVIGLKFPAYHVRHPNKSLWILHQFRTAFEMWGTEHCDLSPDPEGKVIRDSIDSVERALLPEARSIFANSKTVADRLKTHCGIEVPPLYHPPENAEAFEAGPLGDYLYFPSRINKWKRQDLALEALACTKREVKIRFSGLADEPAYFDYLKEKAKRLGVERRVQFLGRIAFPEMVAQYRGCRGVLFIPEQEDYGYVTLEGMLSSKAIITCADSGGPTEFVENGKEGFTSEATPEAVARSMDALWESDSFAHEAGKRSLTKYKELNITWDHVVDSLLK